MAYLIKHGTDPKALAERCETATACLETLRMLQAAEEPDIKILDRNGAELALRPI